jgi:hypothetical protein
MAYVKLVLCYSLYVIRKTIDSRTNNVRFFVILEDYPAYYLWGQA